MIVVTRKADFDSQPFSDFKTACKFYGFVYNTLVREEFPIDLTDFYIQEKQLIKTKRKNNTKNLRNQKDTE
jgi:hypothetical protein